MVYESNEYLKELLKVVREEFPEIAKEEYGLAEIAKSFYSPATLSWKNRNEVK